MATEKLVLDNIQFGYMQARANEALQTVCDDLIARPRINKARTVTIEIKITPEMDEDTELNFPTIDWNVKWSVPGASGMQTKALVDGGEVKVEINNADPRQRVLPLEEASNVVNLAERTAGRS